MHHSNIPHFPLVSILILNTAEGPGPFSGPWQNCLREDLFILLLTEDGYSTTSMPKRCQIQTWMYGTEISWLQHLLLPHTVLCCVQLVIKRLIFSYSSLATKENTTTHFYIYKHWMSWTNHCLNAIWCLLFSHSTVCLCVYKTISIFTWPASRHYY